MGRNIVKTPTTGKVKAAESSLSYFSTSAVTVAVRTESYLEGTYAKIAGVLAYAKRNPTYNATLNTIPATEYQFHV